MVRIAPQYYDMSNFPDCEARRILERITQRIQMRQQKQQVAQQAQAKEEVESNEFKLQASV